MKALVYSKLCTEEQTREKKISVRAFFLMVPEWIFSTLRLFFLAIKIKHYQDTNFSTVSHYLKVFIPKIKNEDTNEVKMLSLF